MKNKSNIFVIILIIVLIIFGIYSIKNKFIQFRIKENTNQVLTAEPIDLGSIETWPTTTISGLLVKYPPKWEVQVNTHSNLSTIFINSDIPMSYVDGGGRTNENMWFTPEDLSNVKCKNGVQTQTDKASPNGISIISGKCAVIKGILIGTESNNASFLKVFELIVQNIK